ncbi:MAG: class B sortase [Christensenellaceae bacterium]|nr:class B sortase [Christensenellaceae bacterium]
MTDKDKSVKKALRFESITMGIIRVIAVIIAVALIIYAGYVLYDTVYTQANVASSWSMQQYKPLIMEDGTVPMAGPEDVARANRDYRAWLDLFGTNIDYPVFQGPDDLYYASHDANGNPSITGAIYLAAGNSPDFSDTYNIIFGHHMDNSILFGQLDSYLSRGYFDSHRDGSLVVWNGGQQRAYTLRVFAVATTDAYEQMIYTPGNRMTEVINFLRNTGGSATTDTVIFEEPPAGTVRVIALSTCMDVDTFGRLTVFCALVPYNGGGGDEPGGDEPSEDGGASEGGEEASPRSEEMEDSETPRADPGADNPGRDVRGTDYWALLNLICLIVTIYTVVPLAHLIAKFCRKKKMLKINGAKEELRTLEMPDAVDLREREKIEEQAVADGAEPEAVTEEQFAGAVSKLYYRIRKFVARFRVGLILEIIVAAMALIAFILTEDMRLPMTIIDEWTPLMIILLAAAWILDVCLVRYRDGREAEEQDEEQDAG